MNPYSKNCFLRFILLLQSQIKIFFMYFRQSSLRSSFIQPFFTFVVMACTFGSYLTAIVLLT